MAHITVPPGWAMWQLSHVTVHPAGPVATSIVEATGSLTALNTCDPLFSQLGHSRFSAFVHVKNNLMGSCQVFKSCVFKVYGLFWRALIKRSQTALCHESYLLHRAKCPSTPVSHDEAPLSEKLSCFLITHVRHSGQLNGCKCKWAPATNTQTEENTR